jgi:hypothetical protein
MVTRNNYLIGWMSILVFCGLVIGLELHAQPLALEKVVSTDWGRIEDLRSAWADDAMGVHHSAPFVNSRRLSFTSQGAGYTDQCTIKNDGYATAPTDPGRKLHHAILIGAFLHGKEVRLTLQGCSYDHPRIIAVEVR